VPSASWLCEHSRQTSRGCCSRMPAACIRNLHACLLLVSTTCTYACCLYQPPARMPAVCISHLRVCLLLVSATCTLLVKCMIPCSGACISMCWHVSWMSLCCASCVRLNVIGPMMCLHNLFCHLDQAEWVLSLLQCHHQSTHKQIGHFKVKRYC